MICNFFYNNQSDNLYFQMTPAPPNVWKGPTRKSWPFFYLYFTCHNKESFFNNDLPLEHQQ